MRVGLYLIVLVAGCASVPSPKSRVEADLAALQAVPPLATATPERLSEYRRLLGNYEASVSEYRQWQACDGEEPDSGWPAHCGRKSERPRVRLDESSAELDRVEVTGSRMAPSDVITNNQEAGIDEGGIFKKHGHHLIALRGSHLYSIAIERDGREVLELADAESLPTGEDGPWLDELLVADGIIVVLGFNYETSTSHVLVFELSARGAISPKGRYEFRSEDYFSWGNYSARLVGDELVLFIRQNFEVESPFDLPEWRTYGAGDAAWQRMRGPTALYLPVSPVQALHLTGFVRCRLSGLRAGHFDCGMAGVISGQPEAHYVASDAAYFSTTDVLRPPGVEHDSPADRWISTVYRLPFAPDESPSFARVPGHITTPLQFSRQGNSLLLVSDDHDQVYTPKGRSSPSPYSKSTAGRSAAEAPDPRSITLRLISIDWSGEPGRLEHEWVVLAEQESRMFEYQTRFGPGRVWVGAQKDRGGAAVRQDNLLLMRVDGTVASATLPYATDRIEVVDDRVFISGRDESWAWHMNLAQAAGPAISVGPPFVMTGVEDAERRTHGFNRGTMSGRTVLGLVGRRITSDDEDDSDSLHAGLFFETEGLQLRPIGQIDAARYAERPAAESYDEPDWYGSARIAFVGERAFMLAKWGLIESQLHGGSLREVRSLALDPGCCR